MMDIRLPAGRQVYEYGVALSGRLRDMISQNHMADKKYGERNIRKITRNGTSHSVSIPVEILKTLGWKERQKVVIKKIRGGVQIKDWKK